MNAAKKLLALLAALALMPAVRIAAQGVSYQRLLHSDSEPQNWLMYDGNYGSQRFSRLDQVNKQNVGQLKPAWIYQPTRMAIIEDAPIVVDGIMYVVEQQDTVTALDARTGRQIWTWTPILRPSITAVWRVTGGAGQTNRGVAVLDNMVYIGTFDDHLVALDATTGAVRWNTTASSRTIATRILTPSHPLRWPSTVRLLLASAAATAPRNASSTPTTRRAASASGVSILCRTAVSPARKPGATISPAWAVAEHGIPAPTIRNST